MSLNILSGYTGDITDKLSSRKDVQHTEELELGTKYFKLVRIKNYIVIQVLFFMSGFPDILTTPVVHLINKIQ